MITTRKHTSQSRLVDKCATMSASGISFSWPDQHQQQHCKVYFTDKKSFTWNSQKTTMTMDGGEKWKWTKSYYTGCDLHYKIHTDTII